MNYALMINIKITKPSTSRMKHRDCIEYPRFLFWYWELARTKLSCFDKKVSSVKVSLVVSYKRIMNSFAYFNLKNYLNRKSNCYLEPHIVSVIIIEIIN
ncbi:hypothetical protein BpHYR1_044141 [Brachionus plicatilis]|uniref:Uncharacterized protein n=1 Tax=Brachionus plicatilis TaxID=10195 RepID=A0A3M7SK65_BRAPC|nr:hypothetical protein BpHYR1_044141 [Brachionus plicatilis]